MSWKIWLSSTSVFQPIQLHLPIDSSTMSPSYFCQDSTYVPFSCLSFCVIIGGSSCWEHTWSCKKHFPKSCFLVPSLTHSRISLLGELDTDSCSFSSRTLLNISSGQHGPQRTFRWDVFMALFPVVVQLILKPEDSYSQ